MEKPEIMPPDEFQIETEMDDILDQGDRKPIARWSKIKYWRICAMLRTDDATVNTFYETASFIYGTLMLDRDKARRIFNILYRYAVDWGLVDERPVDALKLAIDKLKRIRLSDIEAMAAEDRKDLEIYCVDLQELAGDVRRDAARVRDERETRPVNAELGGSNRLRATAR